jgi:3D (Asp-Asp-Asp) domain-containing protein
MKIFSVGSESVSRSVESHQRPTKPKKKKKKKNLIVPQISYYKSSAECTGHTPGGTELKENKTYVCPHRKLPFHY